MAPDDAQPVASSHGGARTELYVQPYIQHGAGVEGKGRGKMTMGYREQGRRRLTGDRPEKRKE